MTAKKLTRKELLRQDEFLTTMEKIQQFWEEQRNVLIISAVALVVAVILIVAGISFFNAREAKGAAALSEALRPFHGSVLGQQSPTRAADDQLQFSSDAEKYQQSISALDGVIDGYGGTEAGRVARLYRAHSLFNLGRYAEALEEYQSFRNAAGNGYLSGLALLNMAQCHKLENDYPAAIETYQQLIDSVAELQFPLDTALCALADCRVESGDQELAAGLYRRVVDEFPESAYRFVAEEKLAALGIEDDTAGLPGSLPLE